MIPVVLALALVSGCSSSEPPTDGTGKTSTAQPPSKAPTTTPTQSASAEAAVGSATMNGPGLVVASCTGDTLQLARIDPDSGRVQGQESFPLVVQDPDLGLLNPSFTCGGPDPQAISQDLRYVGFGQPGTTNNARHVGIWDVDEATFVDVTAATAPSGFSSTSAYDENPQFSIDGTNMYFTRNRSELWQYTVATGKAVKTTAAPDIAPHTTDEAEVYNRPKATLGAVRACPQGAQCFREANLYIFPLSGSDPGQVRAIAVSGEAAEALVVHRFVDDEHVLVGSGTARSFGIVDISRATPGTVTTVEETSLLPENNHVNFDPVASPDGQQVAFYSTDDQGVTNAYLVAATGGDPREIDLKAAYLPGATNARLLRWD